ncbi:MAG: DUF4156 domain-containing protein [Gammaproteobacteria bacterium]|nr:DUF4156 domain-containing protein [Gammaproteobacteria bacterium]
MKLNYFALCLTIVCLPACTWVETTKEGSEVMLVKPFNVKDCLKLGTTSATTTYKVGIITREDETVTEELITLAKNRAAELGGDSIVATGPAVEGKMSFDIYQCAE